LDHAELQEINEKDLKERLIEAQRLSLAI